MRQRIASEITNAKISAATFAPKMRSPPRKIGRIRTDSVWKISVRRKEIAAEIPPLLRAVKNDEEKILKPDSKKQNENNLKACSVIASSSAS